MRRLQDLRVEALAVTTPRSIEINKDAIKSGNRRVEVGIGELQH